MSPSPDAVEAVSQRLNNFLSAQRAATADLGPEARLLVEAGATALDGGKRLRGRFCIAGWRAVEEVARTSPAPPPEVVAAAAALEIFHAAALVHDDVIDNSDTRRGRPAAHRALEAAHRSHEWAGDAAAFGRSGAVLLGDLLVAWSDDLLEEGLAAASAPDAATARTEYATMRREVTIGQFLDIAEESAYVTEPDEKHAERALRVASLKSARYSIQQPLAVGAALAGADAAQQAALAAFGHPVGMAFQLRDDVLGMFGNPLETGKPACDDLRDGKHTLLVTRALVLTTESGRRLVREALGSPDVDEVIAQRCRDVIAASGALASVEAAIDTAIDRALEALTVLGAATCETLTDLALFAAYRDR